jgi:hypothetical protein
MTHIKVHEFIQQYFIDELEQIVEKFPYHAFMIISIGIEHLGKCLNQNTKNFHDGKPKNDFNRALDNLNTFRKYKNINRKYQFYSNLRSGMLHAGVPKRIVTLSSGKQQEHLYVNGGIINLRCEDFFADFKLACLEVISLGTEKTEQTIIVVPSGEFASCEASGSTTVPIYFPHS